MGRQVNAVFEGGGVRGVALAGAAAAALDHGYEFRQLVGTSAGSLVASLLAAGYGARDMARAVCAVEWPSLLQPVAGARIPWLGRHLALLTRRGIYRSERLEQVLGELLAERGVRTFADIPQGLLTIIVTDLSNARGIALPEGLRQYGIDPATFPIARAVRMSAAVPFLFTPVRLRNRITGRTVVFADGAMAANYPVAVARRDRPVLGFRLFNDGPDERFIITGPLSLARAVVLAGIRARYSLPRTIEPGATVIEVPVQADLDFAISNDAARAVFDRGRAAAAAQLEVLHLAA